MANYRYSTPQFRHTLVVAVAISAMVAGLVWMLLRASGNPDAGFWGAAAALVFFAFVSAGMLYRFIRNETVLAVQPTGLRDARHSSTTIPWEDVRGIMLRQRESEFELEVFLWRRQDVSSAGRDPDFIVDLAPLDADVATILEDIGRHKNVETDRAMRFAQ